MTEQERKQKEQALIDAFESEEGVLITRGSSTFSTKENARFGFSAPTLDVAFANLYLIFHNIELYKPEFIVMNPTPSKPQGDFILPKDTYLWKEQKEMESLEYDDFIGYCMDLVINRNVPIIGVVGGLYGKDIVRATMQTLFTPETIEVSSGIPTIGSITGGTAGKNAKAKEDLTRQLNQILR